MKATASDVAKEAGVSLATVDRVLNKRPGVRANTVARVQSAIDKLGYVRDAKAAALARNRNTIIRFLVPDGPSLFMQGLKAQIEQAILAFHSDNIKIKVHTVPAVDSAALSKVMDELDPKNTHGVAVVATDSVEVRGAIRRLTEASIPVVTMISDSPGSSRAHFAGIDNIAAGRTAGELMGRFLEKQKPQPVALIVGSLLLRDHVDRATGFQQVLSERFPHLELHPIIEGGDESATVEAQLKGLLEAEPDLTGVYSAAGGTRGVIAALEATGRDQQVCAITHELTPPARTALERGVLDAVLNQDSGHEVRSAVRVLRSLIDQQPTIASQERIRLEVFIKENLP